MGGDLATVPIKVESDTFEPRIGHIVVENYNEHPALCRSGIWTGYETVFSETVILGWEHDQITPAVAVSWLLNGRPVPSLPDYNQSPPSVGPQPCPGAPWVLYNYPVDGLYHRISLASAYGSQPVSIAAQVSWDSWDYSGDVTNLEGTTPPFDVSLSGSAFMWPAYLIKEEEACLAALWGLLGKLGLLAHVNPGDPVQFLRGLPQEQQVQLKGAAQALSNIDRGEQPELAKALRASVVGILRQGMGRALRSSVGAAPPGEAPPRGMI
jgi:hypothetical protein